MSRRRRLAFRRWVEVLVAGGVGAAVLLLLLHWRRNDLHHAAAVPLWTMIAAAVVFSAVLYRLGEARWGAFIGIRHVVFYPPLWIGSVFGIGVVLLAVGYVDRIREGFRLGDESAPWMVRGLPFAEWGSFAPTVIEAARHEPRIMLPQIAGLLVKELVVMAGRTRLQYEVDTDAAARLFGSIEIVDDLFGREDVAAWAGSPEVEAVLAYLQNRAGQADGQPVS